MKNETRMLHSQPGTKPRPVPPLVIGESIFDRIAFIPLSFQNVLNYFKFLIKEAIFSCANRLEIPRQVAEEIELKIIKRITNLENCGQAVQLIFNYFAWLNEKKPNEMNPLTQKILQEVKLYSDSFVNHIVKKLSNEVVAPELDEYYMTVLPTELNLIYRYALTAVGVDREKFCGQISKSLEWLRRFAKLYTAAKIGAPNNVIVNQNQAKEPVPQFNNCLKPLNVLQKSNVGKSLQYNDNDRIVNQNDTSAFSWNNFHSELRKIEDQKENIPNWDNNWNQSRPQMINNNHSKGFAPQGREIPMNYGFYGQNALDQINGNNSVNEFCTNENSFKPVEYTQFNNWDLRGTFNGFSRNNSQVVNSGSPQMCFSPDSGISTDLEQNFFPISRNGMEQATLMREK